METVAKAAEQERIEQARHIVDCRGLLALYAIIPILLLIVLVDLVLLDGAVVRPILPADPMHLPYWSVIFGLPHIVASMLTMADGQYISHYRKTLLWPLVGFALLSTAGVMGPQPIGQQLLFVFLAFYTIYHVLAQQLGLTLMMMGVPPTPTFKLWKWMSIVAGVVIYLNIYASNYLNYEVMEGLRLYEVLSWLAAVLCAGVIALSFRIASAARHRIGKWYLWGNVAMLTTALLINETGYPLFAIMIPRVIHDVTAYMIYISHDTNRNRSAPVNLIYRLTRFTRLPPLVVLPVLSVAIAFALTSFQDYRIITIAILTLGFLHYYFEGFIWRGANPHRQHLEFRR